MFKLRILKHWLTLFFRPNFKDREKLLQRQKRKLKAFEKEVLSTAPYYQKMLFEGLNIDIFPTITKREFMAHFNGINTVGLDRDECMKAAVDAEINKTFDSEIDGCTIGLSTGTSGNRGLFIASEDERAQWAASVFYKVVKPRFSKKQKVAFCLRANSDLYESVQSSFFSFKFYDIAAPTEVIIKDMQERKPDILCAQPSLLLLLTAAKIDGRLDICPTQIISYAEVLDDADRKKIEAIFNLKITEIYQCTEGFLGYTCTHGTMHLNEDNIRFERQMIDDKRFQPIITDFVRKSQPVVRYLLNDVLVLRESPCPCGSAMTGIERIEGRMDDVLVGENETGDLVYIFPDLVRRRIVWAGEKLNNYAVEQKSLKELILFVDIAEMDYSETCENILESLTNLFNEKGIKDMQISCQKGLPLRDKASKMRRVSRTFEVDI
ncbi:MAG: putative adenylate-forming enzyme [Saprospiraceae bacterium]|jgi:putative adenylate-forming enzyme